VYVDEVTTEAGGRRRQYHQACGIAAGLDVIGERWTLLVIREMLVGSARFNDLLTNLEGIGPNLLSARLKSLQESGLVAQRPVTGDGRGREYVLTQRGEALRPMVLELARWGLGLIHTEDVDTATSRPEWSVLAVESMALGRRLPEDVTETYQFDVSGSTFYLRVVEGVPSVSRQADPDDVPVLRIAAETQTFLRIGARLISPLTAMFSGAISVSGDPDAFERCGYLLELTSESPASARPETTVVGR
jgi:DNA-binding HxlR family transcriptional regulator